MPKKASKIQFRLLEKNAKAELDGMSIDGAYKHPVVQAIAERLPSVVDNLEQSYLKSGNPVHVWDAILQLHIEAVTNSKPLVLPTWVLAYLVGAAKGIMGVAVNRPALPQAGPDKGKKIRRSSAPPPVRMPDGTTHRYSDWFGGCTASERLKLANQALGFISGQGRFNAFEQAYRTQQEEDLLSSANALKSDGATDSVAVQRLNSEALKRTGDKTRKLGRVRRKHRQGSKLR